MNQQNENAKKMGQFIAQCWEDEAFKAKLIANPAAVLKEFGAGGSGRSRNQGG